MMSSLPWLKIRYLIKILNGLKALLLVSKYGYCNFYKLTILYCIWIKIVRKKSERQMEIDICIWFCLSLFISSYWRDKEKGKERERVMERKRRIYICSVCFLSRSLAHTLFLCLFNYLVGYKRAEIWFLWLPPDFFPPPRPSPIKRSKSNILTILWMSQTLYIYFRTIFFLSDCI